MADPAPDDPSATKAILLVTAFLLVAVGRILQVAGVLGDGLTLTYLSIGVTLIAAGVLLIAIRRRR